MCDRAKIDPTRTVYFRRHRSQRYQPGPIDWPPSGFSLSLPFAWQYGQAGPSGLRFYRAQGAYLALFWLLGGSDAHAENVVVSRAGPVWVDTECMCQPELSCAAPVRASMPEWIRESVLTTDMIYRGLPRLAPRAHTGLVYAACANRWRCSTNIR